MVSFWVAVLTAFLGAAAAGVIPWLQTTRDQVSGAKTAREYLIENRRPQRRGRRSVAEGHRLVVAASCRAAHGAWHEYHAVMRDDLGEPYAREVAETIKKLDDLNAWAVTQRGQQERRFDLVREAYLRFTPEQVAASQAVVDQLMPRSDLGAQERDSIHEVRASVETTLAQVRASPSRVASRRRQGQRLLGLPAVLAILAAIILAITLG